MPRKRNDHYFELKFSLRRKNKKKKSSSGLGQGQGKKDHGNDIFWGIVGLSLFLVLYMYLSFTFENLIMSVKLFSILATLGGLETYDQTVYGLTIIFFVGGIALIVGLLDQD